MARIAMYPNPGVNIERHAYCLCLHVRPATIFVALVNLGGSLICAGLTLYFVLYGHSKSTNYLSSHLLREEMNRVTGISVLMYLLLALVSAMLLYGVLKSKPSYILPFFGIQFIDYLFTMPQFLASMYTQPYHNYYMNKAKEQLELSGDQTKGGQGWSSQSANEHMYTTSLFFMTLILIFKTYFLCVVWKCYRYLHMKEFILPLSIGNHLAHETMMTPIVITQANAPPPNYEEATKMPDIKPPEYRSVIEQSNNPVENNVGTSSSSHLTATAENGASVKIVDKLDNV